MSEAFKKLKERVARLRVLDEALLERQLAFEKCSLSLTHLRFQ